MGTLQVGGTTLGVKNTSTNKVDLSNVGDDSVIPASVGSSMVLVKSSQGFSVTNSDTLASAYIENCFNSTYRDYVIYITGTIGTTQAELGFRFGNSSGRINDSHYLYVNKGWDSSGTTRSVTGSNTSYAVILGGADGAIPETNLHYDKVVITMKIHNPQSSGGIIWTGTNSMPRYGTAFINSHIGGTYRGDNNSATNMQFYWTSTQTGTFNFQSYGIKTS